MKSEFTLKTERCKGCGICAAFCPKEALELVDGKVREYDIHPEDFGLRMYASRNFKVSSAEESKEIILDVLGGRASPASPAASWI